MIVIFFIGIGASSVLAGIANDPLLIAVSATFVAVLFLLSSEKSVEHESRSTA